jgi:UrcA family protein
VPRYFSWRILTLFAQKKPTGIHGFAQPFRVKLGTDPTCNDRLSKCAGSRQQPAPPAPSLFSNPWRIPMIRQLLLLTVIAATWTAPPCNLAEAAAAPVLVSPEMVRYDSIDLRSSEGIARLYGRLWQAARGSCESLPRLYVWTASARGRCQSETLEAAIRQVHDARLTAHHRACQRQRPLCAIS